MIENDSQELLDEILVSVSSGDALSLSSVSGSDAYYEINIYTVSGNDGATAQETQYTLWDKPLEMYSVSEGLLLILCVIVLSALIWVIVQGGFKWRK